VSEATSVPPFSTLDTADTETPASPAMADSVDVRELATVVLPVFSKSQRSRNPPDERLTALSWSI
jgi:hypothetical protein